MTTGRQDRWFRLLGRLEWNPEFPAPADYVIPGLKHGIQVEIETQIDIDINT